MVSKTKGLDQMRLSLHLKHRSIGSEDTEVYRQGRMIDPGAERKSGATRLCWSKGGGGQGHAGIPSSAVYACWTPAGVPCRLCLIALHAHFF
jgi:hypothetical protein